MKTKLPEQPSDPRLIEAMAKIKAIVKEYDCGALVSLHSQTHAEYLFHVEPSWSLAKVQDGVMRFKCKMKTGTPEEKEAGRLTASLFMGYGEPSTGNDA